MPGALTYRVRGGFSVRRWRSRYPCASCWLLGAAFASESSSNRARGSSQARLVVGEFFPDFLGLPAAADKPFGGIVRVASHEIAHSHLN